jgi:hypothetical protein
MWLVAKSLGSCTATSKGQDLWSDLDRCDIGKRCRGLRARLGYLKHLSNDLALFILCQGERFADTDEAEDRITRTLDPNPPPDTAGYLMSRNWAVLSGPCAALETKLQLNESRSRVRDRQHYRHRAGSHSE